MVTEIIGKKITIEDINETQLVEATWKMFPDELNITGEQKQ